MMFIHRVKINASQLAGIDVPRTRWKVRLSGERIHKGDDIIIAINLRKFGNTL